MTEAVLVVDDLRTFPHLSAVYARNSSEALVALAAIETVGGRLHRLWLDCDLGLLPDGIADDVRRVVRWLEERAFHGHALPITEVVVHTSNSVGAHSVEQALRPYYKVTGLMPPRSEPLPSPNAASRLQVEMSQHQHVANVRRSRSGLH